MPGRISRVLVADDDPGLRKLLQFSLQAIGKWQVTLCSSGAEVVAQALGAQPDLILLDVQMPGLDGPTAFLALQGQPALRQVPVIFLTSGAAPEEQARLRSLGARGVIEKPFDPMTLPSRILAVLSSSIG